MLLSERRSRAGLSRFDVAALAGVTYSAVRHVEIGLTLSDRMVDVMATAYGVTKSQIKRDWRESRDHARRTARAKLAVRQHLAGAAAT